MEITGATEKSTSDEIVYTTNEKTMKSAYQFLVGEDFLETFFSQNSRGYVEFIYGGVYFINDPEGWIISITPSDTKFSYNDEENKRVKSRLIEILEGDKNKNGK